MDPDVFATIAFSGYAFIAALAIGAVLRATSGHRDGSRNDAPSDVPLRGPTPPIRDADKK